MAAMERHRARMLAVLKQFRLLVRAMDAHYRDVERFSGLGGAQLWALQEIASEPGLGAGELAQRLAIHASTASNLVRRLEQLRLVGRERPSSDQRRVVLRATAAGRARLKGVRGPPEGLLQQALAELSERRLGVLHGELDRLLTHMKGLDRRGTLIPMSQILAEKMPSRQPAKKEKRP
jgi:DNA-binding MarR family transcriptional regulator